MWFLFHISKPSSFFFFFVISVYFAPSFCVSPCIMICERFHKTICKKVSLSPTITLWIARVGKIHTHKQQSKFNFANHANG